MYRSRQTNIGYKQLKKTNTMKDITITTYNGYSTVAGETTLTQVIKEIREGKNLAIVQRIEKLVQQGETEKADRTKKQLPYLTLTANYHQERLAYSIKNYNPVITIDIDKLKDEQIGPLRERIESDPNVLADFLTPKRHGFKVFVYLQSAWACKMRKAAFTPPGDHIRAVGILPRTDVQGMSGAH